MQKGVFVMSEQNKTLIRRFAEEIWNKKDSSKLEDFLAPNCSMQTPDGVLRGINEYKQLHETYIRAFPDCKMTIDEVMSEGDMVAARYTFTGTHKGELKGVAPTGKRVNETVMVLCRISNGKVTEQTTVWDRLALLEKLGVAPEAVKLFARSAAR
jgi:steroid delta-isomerase-like uncharacterized protein